MQCTPSKAKLIRQSYPDAALPIKAWLLIACDTGFDAIIKVKMSLHLHTHSTLCMQAVHTLVSLCISAGSPVPLIAIKIKISLCWHYFMNFLYHVR